MLIMHFVERFEELTRPAPHPPQAMDARELSWPATFANSSAIERLLVMRHRPINVENLPIISQPADDSDCDPHWRPGRVCTAARRSRREIGIFGWPA